jgi:hypothetical protein
MPTKREYFTALFGDKIRLRQCQRAATGGVTIGFSAGIF